MVSTGAPHATGNTKPPQPSNGGPLDVANHPCNASGGGSESTIEAITKPKKKRIRRAKLELEFLRREAVKLENELIQLLQIQSQRHENTNSIRPPEVQLKSVDTDGRYRLIAPHFYRKRSVWQEIAKRQAKERERAVSRNLELRGHLELEFKLERQLMHLLNRQNDAKEYIGATGIQYGVTPDAGYKEMLEHAENTLLDIKKVLRSDVFNDTSNCFVDTFVEKEDGRDVFVVKANVILPFGMMTAANALWTVLSTDKIGEFCYFHRVAQKTENTIAQAFGIRCADEDVDADFRGKYTFSRFKDGDHMVIVWVAEFEPVELNGVRCCGIKCQTTGWIQLSEQLSGQLPKQQSGKVGMTHAYAYSRLNLESDPSKCSDMLPLHSFLSLAQRMHDKFMLSYSSVLEKALFEEDWKMNIE